MEVGAILGFKGMGPPMGKAKGEVKMATAALGMSLTSKWKIKFGAVDDGEAGKVLEQGMRMANLRVTRMMMATRSAAAETLWPMV